MTVKDTLVILAVTFTVLIVIAFSSDEQEIVRYDCRIAEISVDYPTEIKEACRRMRKEKNK